MQDLIHTFARSRGASIVGFAPAESFQDAPRGFGPTDLMASARGVVVLGKALPKGVVDSGNAAVYSLHHGHLMQLLDTLAYEVALFIEAQGAQAMPLPADDPYFHWEPERKHGIGLFSHRHAAVKAGLGTIGRNALLVTPGYGNRVELVSVLTTLPFPPALPMESLCLPGCSLCLEGCPSGALSGDGTVEQKPCREYIAARTDRGHAIYRCWQCRAVCPA